MPAPTQNAAWKPDVSACGTASPAFAASFVWAIATDESTAMPSAPPICCDVLISPEARPASFASIPASAAIEIETNENAMPERDDQEARAAGRRGTSRRRRPA